MKKFKYRLEPLLKVRKHREKERQKEHAAAMKKVQDQQDQLHRIDDSKMATIDSHRQRLMGKITVAEALVCSRYLTRLKRDRLAGYEILQGLKRKAETRREELVEAARERKIYELLREKQERRHLKEIEDFEQKETNEVAISAYRQKKKKGQ
ncbi:MAG: flagellar export protein FliJ [candidate division Zixibacteria bacterium]|nr:flagellar export protein FliJ [candidate division Zixibacteria bacterium]